MISRNPPKHLFLTTSFTLLLISTIQAPSFDSSFSKVNPGDRVTGKVEESHLFISLDECIVRCSGSSECKACQYNGTRPGNCILISDNSTSEDETMFVSDSSNIIFLKVNSSGSIPAPDGSMEPIGWTGPDPILYWSLDTLDGLVLMEGTQQKNYNALTEGKVKTSLRLVRTKRQWVDLGIQTDACLVVPETCGPEGAAVAFWVKIHHCSGVMSSFAARTGFMIYCLSADQRMIFWVALSYVAKYNFFQKVDDQWIHLVLNFNGLNGEFQVFRDGALDLGQQPTTSGAYRSPGDGRFVLGRRYPNSDGFYSSVDLDEVVFINRKLTEAEVETIYNNY